MALARKHKDLSRSLPSPAVAIGLYLETSSAGAGNEKRLLKREHYNLL